MLLYIDPGTGSMLFTILLGIFGTVFYSIRLFFVKMHSWFGGEKVKKDNLKVDFAIYSDDKRYWNIFEPIIKEMAKRGRNVHFLAASEDDPVFKCGLKNVTAECIGKKNSSWFRLNYFNATILLSTTPGLGVYQWKRSKKVKCYVHIPHMANDITLYRMFGLDYYDTILLSGEYQVKQIRDLEKLRDLPSKELVKVGIPYMDVMAERLITAKPVEEHPRTVVLAPSWGSSAIFSVYGGKIIDELLKTGYHIIIRPHPQSFTAEKEIMDKLMEKYPDSEQIEWNRDRDNFEVLRRSDILISDFSGVIFDFALIYGKPVIYTDPNFDLSPYDAWWLKDPIWTVSALKRIGMQLDKDNLSNIKGLIDDCLDNSDISKHLQEVKDESWEHFGKGAEKTVDYLIAKFEELEPKKEEKQSLVEESDKSLQEPELEDDKIKENSSLEANREVLGQDLEKDEKLDLNAQNLNDFVTVEEKQNSPKQISLNDLLGEGDGEVFESLKKEADKSLAQLNLQERREE